jgi:hypothetical protein
MTGALAVAPAAELFAMTIAVAALSLALLARLWLEHERHAAPCSRCGRRAPSTLVHEEDGPVCHCCLYGCPECGPARTRRAASS